MDGVEQVARPGSRSALQVADKQRGDWAVPSSWPSLSGDDVHLWLVDVDVNKSRRDALERLLSGDEIARASRFRFERDRARFLTGRGLLRTILGRYLGRAPESIQISHSDFGKSSITPSMGVERLRFNASGSEEIALVAVRLDAEVGIDVERLRSIPDALAIAKRMLADEEYNDFVALPEERRDTRFLDYWVRKEAFVKALGKGLRHPFDSFSLHPWPDAESRQVTIELDGQTVALWVIPVAVPREDCVAALATPGPVNSLRHWTLDALAEG